MKIKIFGFIYLNRNQFVTVEIILFSFFFLLTVFFFSWSVPEYVTDPMILFHARYLKYVTLILSFFTVIETQYYLNKFINKQLEINEEQRKKIALQNDEIFQSIRYAKHIQESILPPIKKLPDNLKYFIFYKPRDIVSGDFYWFTQKHNHTFIVAADCTGHGVPGAFMSILGISVFNEIFNENHSDLHTDEILNILREKVIASLKQENNDLISEAGMDLSLIKIDAEKKNLEFSGAKNPIFIIRQKQKSEESDIPESKKTFTENYVLYHLVPDNMPIGKFPRKLNFRKQEIKLFKEDTIYMFSDGFVDQMGGNLGKKLMNNRFKALLLQVYKLPLEQQKTVIDKFLNKWKGNFKQTDDILIMGIKV